MTAFAPEALRTTIVGNDASTITLDLSGEQARELAGAVRDLVGAMGVDDDSRAVDLGWAEVEIDTCGIRDCGDMRIGVTGESIETAVYLDAAHVDDLLAQLDGN